MEPSCYVPKCRTCPYRDDCANYVATDEYTSDWDTTTYTDTGINVRWNRVI